MRWLRRAEIALCVIGFSLLGVAFAAIVHTEVYQARQGRAFSYMEQRAAASTHGPESPLDLASARPPTPAPDADPLVLGRIEIPRIGVSAIVREGDDETTLAVAVGHFPGTARPGERGNMALAGHRDSFFRALRHIQVDDVIHVRALGRGYEYRVDSTEVVRAEETRVLDPTRDTVLTLVTCYPFGYVGHAPKRFVVHARLSLSFVPLLLERRVHDLVPSSSQPNRRLSGAPTALTLSVDRGT